LKPLVQLRRRMKNTNSRPKGGWHRLRSRRLMTILGIA